MNRPYCIEITRTVDTDAIVRYWIGGIALMLDPDGRWGAYPGGTWAERPLWMSDSLEACMDMAAGAVALMQPVEDQ